MKKIICLLLFGSGSFAIAQSKVITTVNGEKLTYSPTVIGAATPDPSSAFEVKSTTGGLLAPRMTTVERNAIATPAIGLMIYNTTTSCYEFYTGLVWYNQCGSDTSPTSSGGTAVITSYYYSADGILGRAMVGQETSIAGVGLDIYAVVQTLGTYDLFTATVNGITYKASGTFTALGNQKISLKASGVPVSIGTYNFTLNTNPGVAFSIIVQPSLASGTVLGNAGKVWLDRPVGAQRRSQYWDDLQGFGGLYQWGRNSDGHQVVYKSRWDTPTYLSPVTTTVSQTIVPGHGNFIIPTPGTGGYHDDWFKFTTAAGAGRWNQFPQDNNPCPSGFRVPQIDELAAEVKASSPGVFTNSPLDILVGGYRDINNPGVLSDTQGRYAWSANVEGETVYGYYIKVGLGVVTVGFINLTSGLPVYCIAE
ncbi:hypothetical protein CLU81_0591 [Flavobacterium sp. 9]|uniref:hypothetical protein n=1 Tax=Flavobacterium sp. 9 TaxID=2035198 RepID=UPI000C1A1759|nr:hypothetical protein [Flavobacterium sp. 9]PIF30183.1 hypothetical protein CLU81_0591 [Flavobacterium sp. 9]